MKVDRRSLWIAVGALGCFALAFLLMWAFSGRFDTGEGRNVAGDMTRITDPPRAYRGAQEGKPEVVQEDQWVVYVTGAVIRPGVVKVPPGSRVYVAVEAAGGPAVRADLEAINMASPLSDGDHVRVPFKGEPAGAAPPPTASSRMSSHSAPPPPQGGVRSPSSPVPSPAPAGKVNVNRAGLEELKSLPGVGDKTAQAIIDYRTANGPFRDVKDLMKVKGIGPKKLEKMAPLVEVSP